MNQIPTINIQIYKIINKKWTFQILLLLKENQKYSYNSIHTILHIPTSTLDLRLNELIKYKLVEKFIYGSIRKPHYTDYKITQFGVNNINTILNLLQ